MFEKVKRVSIKMMLESNPVFIKAIVDFLAEDGKVTKEDLLQMVKENCQNWEIGPSKQEEQEEITQLIAEMEKEENENK